MDNGDGTENILQRVYLENGAFYDRPAGNFVFHPQHDHIHVEGWSTYRLRQVLPGDGVGAEVAKGEKTSFCILDLGIEDSSLPNFSATGEFFSCASTVQGLSVGWVDVYSKGLPDQELSAGLHEIIWDGTDQRGRRVVSGVYFQHVVAPDLRRSQKLLLLK